MEQDLTNQNTIATNNSDVNNQVVKQPVEKQTKGLKALIITLIILLLFLTGAFGYYVLQNESAKDFGSDVMVVISPLPSPTVTTEFIVPSEVKTDESNLKSQSIKYKPQPTWSTYTDEIAGFSIQYNENPTDPYNSHSSLGTYEKGKNVYFIGCMTPPSGYMAGKEVCTGGRWISVYNNYEGGSRRAWFSQNMLGYSQNCKKYYENLMIAGVNGLVVTSNCGSFGEHSILIPKGNQMIVISNEGFTWDEEKEAIKFDNYEISTLETFRLNN